MNDLILFENNIANKTFTKIDSPVAIETGASGLDIIETKMVTKVNVGCHGNLLPGQALYTASRVCLCWLVGT